MSFKGKILVLAVAVGGFQAYEIFYSKPTYQSATSERPYSRQKKYSKSKFRCDGRQYCSQMNSRAEAEYFTKYCLNTKMDGDRDGIPCENDSRW